MTDITHLPPGMCVSTALAFPELDVMDDDSLLERIMSNRRASCEKERENAKAVALLEAHGIDLSEHLPHHELASYRLIASGRLLPEVFHSFRKNPAAVRRISNLPLEDQQQLVRTGRVEMLDDKGTTILAPVVNLKPPQVEMVFSDNHIRSIAEQRVIESNRRLAAYHAPAPADDEENDSVL